MPQSANQDYTIISPALSEKVINDAGAMAQIAHQIERNTIFDCLVKNPGKPGDASRGYGLFRPVFVGRDKQSFGFFDPSIPPNGGTILIGLTNSAAQYDVLAKIQEQDNVAFIPFISYADETNYLYLDNDDAWLIVNGCKVRGGTDGAGRFSWWEQTDEKPEAGEKTILLTAQDLNNLIGFQME